MHGPLPDLSRNLKLHKVHAAGNAFTGPIKLERLPVGGMLAKLNVFGNKLTGTLPNFSLLPTLVYIDVSENSLSGEVRPAIRSRQRPRLVLGCKTRPRAPQVPTLAPDMELFQARNSGLAGAIPHFGNRHKVHKPNFRNP